MSPSQARVEGVVASPAGASEITPLLANTAANGKGSSSSDDGGGGRLLVPSAEETSAGAAGPTREVDDGGEVTIVSTDMSLIRLMAIMPAVWLGVFLAAADNSLVSTISAPLTSSFGDMTLINWLATVYIVAAAVSQPTLGRLTDIFGRGPGLVVGNLLFAAGNLMCGMATDGTTILAGRVVSGIGGGAILVIGTFVGSDLVSLRRRGIIQGFGNACYGIGIVCGGVIGGVLNDTVGWRWAFLGQVPISLLSAALCAWLVRVPPKESDRSLIARIDFVGVLLTVAFLFVLLLGLNAGGTIVPWSHPLVLTALPLSVVLLAVWVWWELRFPYPIMPLRLLTDRTIFSSCACLFFTSMGNMPLAFYLPLYLETVLDMSPSRVGLQLTGAAVGIILGSMGVGITMRRTGTYRLPAIVAMSLAVVSISMTNLIGRFSPTWLPALIYLLAATGLSGVLTTTLVAVTSSDKQGNQAVLVSATYLARTTGNTIGLTISGAIYQNVLRTRLWDRFGHLPGAAEEINRIRNDINELHRLPDGWHDGVLDSFVDAFRGLWVTVTVCSLLGLISISMIRQNKLHDTLART